MKILLLGYGKMGRTIHQLAESQGHEVIYADNAVERNSLDLSGVDVVIEFSQPDTAYENILFCLDRGIPVVSGTTGWLERQSEVENRCRSTNGTFFYASNYSLGVNLFFHLNKSLAKMMKNFSNYNVHIEETHHTEKKDSPSGTALTIAEGLLTHLDHKAGWSENPTAPEQIEIIARRKGQVPGTHKVIYQSEMDSIEITHTANSREIFASGALQVALWLVGKQGVFNMDDFMGDLKGRAESD